MANKHTKAQCEFIVRKLAAFEPPRAIALDFCAVYTGTKCDENDVKRLDPKAGAILSPELHTLFKETREAVLLDPDSAIFASQKARLILLSNHVAFYNSNNQLPEARSVMRHIAEELDVIAPGGKGSKGGGAAGSASTPEFKKIEVTRTIVHPAKADAE